MKIDIKDIHKMWTEKFLLEHDVKCIFYAYNCKEQPYPSGASIAYWRYYQCAQNLATKYRVIHVDTLHFDPYMLQIISNNGHTVEPNEIQF